MVEPIKLTDLNPKWVGMPGRVFSIEGKAVKVGLTFDCPCPACAVPPKVGRRLAISFTPPIDPHMVLPGTTWAPSSPSWQRTGDTFENITLTPSIDFSSHGHWHGFITDGKAVSA